MGRGVETGMARNLRGGLIVAIVVVVVVVPIVYYRATYAHAKRLRVVAPGRLYRSGQMPVRGFEEAVRRAGLHRTGCMAAIYRMEYEGWTPEQAVEEMKTHGFGDVACTAANDYVYQYVLTYRRGLRSGRPVERTVHAPGP